jgi:hypothetical protein
MQQQQPAPSDTSGFEKPTRDKVARVGALLRGEKPETGKPQQQAPTGEQTEGADEVLAKELLAPTKPEKAAAAEGESPENTAPKTLNDLAEKLGVKVEDLFAITFPAAGNGESHTLGELKDMLAKQSDFTARSLEFEETRVQSENELLRAKQDLQAIVGLLPKDAIKPALLERVRVEHERYREVEGQRVLSAIPSWKDEQARATDRAGMAKHLSAYGYGEQHLDAIVDHRMLKYIRDNWQREARVTAALAKTKEVKPSQPARTSVPHKPKPALKAGPDSPRSLQVAAIGELLRGG